MKAASGDDSVTTRDVIEKRSDPLTIPVRAVTTLESIVCGYRAEMLEIGPGKVLTGGGFGSEFIHLEWGEHKAVLRGSELLRAWVAMFDPEGADQFPEHVRRA